MRLSDFQDGLASALLPPPGAGAPPPAWLDALLAQPGFAVYRNTVAKGCIDALQANYPAVHALVGTDWLRAAAHARPRRDLGARALHGALRVRGAPAHRLPGVRVDLRRGHQPAVLRGAALEAEAPLVDELIGEARREPVERLCERLRV